MHPLSLPSSLLAALWSSLWTFCFSQLPDLFPLLFSGGSPLPALLTRLLAALLLCLGLPLFTGLLACAPWVLPGLVLGASSLARAADSTAAAKSHPGKFHGANSVCIHPTAKR